MDIQNCKEGILVMYKGEYSGFLPDGTFDDNDTYREEPAIVLELNLGAEHNHVKVCFKYPIRPDVDHEGGWIGTHIDEIPVAKLTPIATWDGVVSKIGR
jgi:hypothetical protein